MLKQKEEPDRGRDVQKKVDLQDIFRNAFYPLTLPLTVGPGSISVAITLGANLTPPLRTNLPAILATLIGSGVVAPTIHVCYGFADRMAPVIGEGGMGSVLRLFSFLLLRLGVQLLRTGPSALARSRAPVALTTRC